MTYAHVVMWFWVVALGATLGGLAVALRALTRADAAVARLQAAVDGTDVLAPAVAAARSATGATARAHDELALRATPPAG